jgi:hypothetical protein
MISRATGVVSIVAVAAAAWAASCGMRPPREYHEASDAVAMDLAPMPASGGADAGSNEDDEADASPDGPGMGKLSIGLPWAAMPAVPIAALLGKSRTDIEALHHPTKPETKEQRILARREAKEGWTRYTANLRIRFDDTDIAVEIEQQVPATLSCQDAAKWLGFEDAEPPVDGKERCTWTDQAGDADLGGGAHGELDRKKSLFKAFKPAPQTTP